MLFFETMGLCVRDSMPLTAARSPFKGVEGDILGACGHSRGRVCVDRWEDRDEGIWAPWAW